MALEHTEGELNAGAGIPPEAGGNGSTPPEAASPEVNSEPAGDAQDHGAGEDPQLKAAVRGIHQKAREAQELARENQALKEQIDMFQKGLKDPNFVRTLNDHYARVQGPAEAEPSEEDMVKQTGLDKDFIGAFDRYLAARGVLRRGDPELREAQQLLYGLVQDRAGSAFSQLTEKYPDAARKESDIRGLVQRSNGALTLEQAYHALTGGQARPKEEVQRAEVEAKARANLPKNGKSGPSPGKPRTYDSFDEAFYESMKELKLNSLRGR